MRMYQLRQYGCFSCEGRITVSQTGISATLEASANTHAYGGGAGSGSPAGPLDTPRPYDKQGGGMSGYE